MFKDRKEVSVIRGRVEGWEKVVRMELGKCRVYKVLLVIVRIWGMILRGVGGFCRVLSKDIYDLVDFVKGFFGFMLRRDEGR